MLLPACAILLLVTCSENSIGPTLKPPKDPFEMTWTADTIAYEGSMQTLMSNILAFNSKDIFIYGHNDGAFGKVYHYDGIKWEEYDLIKYLYGFNVSKMIAFSRNNICGVGDRGGRKGLIFNYNGNIWTEYTSAGSYSPLLSIDGVTADEFYVSGRNGVVWYNKNGSWIIDTVKIILPQNTELELHSIAVYNGQVFILGWALNPSIHFDKHYLIQGKIKNWVAVDSMDFTKDIPVQRWGWSNFMKDINGKLYSRGLQGIYEWDGNSWNKINSSEGWGFYVYNDNYMINLGKGGIDFYNGKSWKRLEEIFNNYKDVTFRAAWTDGSELFLVGNTFDFYPQKTIVLHGK